MKNSKNSRWVSVIVGTLFLFVGILWSISSFQGFERHFINTILIPTVFIFVAFVLFNLPSEKDGDNLETKTNRLASVRGSAIVFLVSIVVVFVVLYFDVSSGGLGMSSIFTIPLAVICFIVLVIQLILYFGKM
ncbi:MAG: hypothetical protein Q8P86_01400 [bacterium]|nr:hypothetical protein [bacterium]